MTCWSLQEDAQGFGELILDVPGHRHNVLSREVLAELDRVLAGLEGRTLRGLIIRSGKPQSFIVGADVREFRLIMDVARAAELTRAGQLVLSRLARLPFPTAAVIHGPCLGGGLELALACGYRVVADDAQTSLGLPEVKLGIHPGFGGTVRLPALIGPLPALDMILSGRPIGAFRAKRLGLVDLCVPERHLRAAALDILARVPPKHRPSWYHFLLSAPVLRPYVGALVRRKLARKVKPFHYPAPHRVLALWARHGSEEAEALSCAELLVGSQSRALVRLFLLAEDFKRHARETAHEVHHIHVVGAGVMGADIAAWAVTKGFTVTLQDRHPKVLAKAVMRAHTLFAEKLRGRPLQAAMDRLIPDSAGHGVRRADMVMEAIIEDVEAKRTLWKTIEAQAPAHALFATNTSSIPLEEIAQALSAPQRLIGLHFFNPVAKMQLIEVIAGAASDPLSIARARHVAVALDRLPIDVRSAPGFLVNRALMPYLLEAVLLAEEGVPLEDIDASAEAFGMPMGPIALADTVGLDICLSVARTLSGPLGLAVPALLGAKVAAGTLGKKTGKGFYNYPRPHTSVRPKPKVDRALAERLILRLVNEAACALREGVVADADVVDMGLVYGTGFAPFYGGPLGYAHMLGPQNVLARLEVLQTAQGTRFKPDPAWRQEAVLAQRHVMAE